MNMSPAMSSRKPVTETDEALRQLGIVSQTHVIYLWNGYRYSNAADAIAAAKRAAR